MIKRFLLGCLFSHDYFVYTRDADGHLVLQCTNCTQHIPVLQGDPLKGPAHSVRQKVVMGEPITTVKKVGRERTCAAAAVRAFAGRK